VSEAKEKTKAILAKGIRGGTPVAAAACRSSRRASAAPTPATWCARRSSRCGRATTWRSSRICRRSGDRGGVAGIRERIRANDAREHLRRRAALPALDRAVPQGRTEHVRRVRHHRRGRDEHADPGAPYTFKQLKRAQAVGDYQTLEAHDRRTVRIHFDRDVDPVSSLRGLFSWVFDRRKRSSEEILRKES
jgi:hypothetical protein